MKSTVFLVLLICCLAQCRKPLVPLDKTANIAFINNEGGGGLRQGSAKPGSPSLVVPPNSPVKPAPAPTPNISQPPKPVNQPTNQLNSPTLNQKTPQQLPSKPAPITPPIKPIPVATVPPKAVPAGVPVKTGTPVTTPGPGSVKQLVNFYDSQGKASVIRPYSYSQAVKQG